MAHYALGHIAEAENCFRAALRLCPDHANATLNLGSTRQILNHVEQAEALFRRALTLGVDPCHGKSNLSLALMEQARPEEAERCLREALALRPNYAEARSNLALALLMLGRLEEGWRDYESRWEVEAMAGPPRYCSQPRWTGQALNGETVLLYAEQGFGDTLQFCRYAPMVAAAGGRVVLVVPKVAAPTDDDAGWRRRAVEDDDDSPAVSTITARCSACRLRSDDDADDPAAIPYLHADASGPGRDLLADLPGLKVGLVWAGKSRTAQPHAVAIDKRSSMRLTDMAPLLWFLVQFRVAPMRGPASQMHAGRTGRLARCVPDGWRTGRTPRD